MVDNTSGWSIERCFGAASVFHARPIPEPVHRAVWVHEVDRPALVLGSAQRDSIVDAAAADAAGVEVARRRSGGGAVLLVPSEVVWVDVVIGADDALWCADVGRSMFWLGEVWAAALGPGAVVHRGPMTRDRWSALACFAGVGPGEVTRDGRKVVGISQRRTRAAARFQCALYRRFEASALARLLALEDDDRRALTRVLGDRVDVIADFTVERFLAALAVHAPVA